MTTSISSTANFVHDLTSKIFYFELLENFSNCFVWFCRLFNGDPVLGETVNAFINENHAEYAANFVPVLTEPFRALFNEIVSRVLSDIPVDQFLSIKAWIQYKFDRQFCAHCAVYFRFNFLNFDCFVNVQLVHQ